MKKHVQTLAILLAVAAGSLAAAQGHYKSFTVSTYVIQGTVQGLMNGNPDLGQSWATLTRNLKIDKIYIEVMRNHTLVDEAGLDRLKKFFQDQGVEVCGGLAYSISESYGFLGFDYADPENREFALKAVEMAARHFDEILLDDYYFFNRKTDYDIKAKGNKSWTQYRLEAMRDVTENLIIKPAKAVNPKCRVIIKMANWYDQYAGMGNDTEKVPLMADGMFSGTESRLWFGQEQHLQPYLSYDIMRFMDNLKPGVNKGGWVDQGGSNPIDRYAEQVLDTVFARCPEMCCFHWAGMLGAIRGSVNRTWADQPTSLNLAEVQKTVPEGGSLLFADVAADILGQVDQVLVQVGKPVGIKCYTPYHATGEEFLHDYLGMIGLPMDIFPQFPTDAAMVLLTEQAKWDPDIIHKIQAQLEAGKSVAVTSGFVRAMKGKGIEDLCEIEATGTTVAVRRFTFAGGPGAPFRRGRGAWISEDLLHWSFQRVANVPVAPHVVKYNGNFYLCGNDGPLFKADSPLGPFTSLGPWKNTPDVAGGWNGPFDMDIYVDDDNRPYLYCPGRGISGIFVVPLDPNDLTRFAGPLRRLFTFNKDHV